MTEQVFLKKSASRTSSMAGLPIIALIGARPVEGEIGIEIEVEGNKFPKGAGYELSSGDAAKIPKQWKYTHDGSLRGADNAEYVLAKPLKFNEVDKAVHDLWQMFADYGSVLTDSNRTSVHVHLNVQQFHINRLCSFVSMYFVLEELLTSWCGDHRVGNLFCLRGRDAPAIVRRLKEFFQQDGYGYEFSSGMHYAGLNPSAIHKFGSVEIRSLRGVNDPQVILDWVSVLERLYVLSGEFKDPREVVSGFSGAGPIAWLQNMLGDKYSVIMNNVPYTTDEVRDILYHGIRLAQDLCYCRDWSTFEEKKYEGDPFRRSAKVSIVAQPTAFATAYASVPTSPTGLNVHGTGYTVNYMVNKVSELRAAGVINTSTQASLLGMGITQLQDWLISMGYLAPIPAQDEPEDDYDPEEDYYDEDDE